MTTTRKARPPKLTRPQLWALGVHAGTHPYVYISPITTYWLVRNLLIERGEKGKWVLTYRGRCALDSGHLPD